MADAYIVTAKEASTKKENSSYTVENVVRHDNSNTGTHYILCEYGYGPQGDTMEPVDHIADHFVEVFWRSVRKGQLKAKYTRWKRAIIGEQVAAKKTTTEIKAPKGATTTLRCLPCLSRPI